VDLARRSQIFVSKIPREDEWMKENAQYIVS
jgi:hypothetical protein